MQMTYAEAAALLALDRKFPGLVLDDALMTAEMVIATMKAA